jgi:hypothetical protein
MTIKDLTIIIFSGDNSHARADIAGRLSMYLATNLDNPIKILSPYEPQNYIGLWHKIDPLNYGEAMRFQVKELGSHFSTKYVMFCETDGYPINFDLWSYDFMKFDYIGAVWNKDWNLLNGGRVGNMGCSIISKRFIDWISVQEYNWMPGDVFICQHLKPKAEAEGFTYADVETALRFSFENPIEIEWDRSKSFAKHFKGEHFQ